MTPRIPMRSVGLRRGSVPWPRPPAPPRGGRGPLPTPKKHNLMLSSIAHAAAMETLLIDTPHMAAIWTDLFKSLLVCSPEFRWRENGPGIGTDARVAYSGLLGRYLARGYLMMHEGVEILIPMNIAKEGFKGTEYRITKDPPGKGHLADWIGIADRKIVIAEAKGTHDEGKRPWLDGHPSQLVTAIEQADRTQFFHEKSRTYRPAMRWAVVSRWATEDNKLDPSLLAAYDPGQDLDSDDYQTLAKIIRRISVISVIDAMGHGNILVKGKDCVRRISETEMRPIQIDIGHRDSYIAAVAGPMGLRAVRNQDRLQKWFQLGPEGNLTVLLLSTEYVNAVMDGGRVSEEPIAKEHWARHAGLTALRVNSMEHLVQTLDPKRQ